MKKLATKKVGIVTLATIAFFVASTMVVVAVKPVKYTAREVLNRVFDSANNRLMTTPGLAVQPVKYTEQEVLNFVYDEQNNMLSTSGGGGGSGTVDVNGTPTAGQVAIWTDENTIEGTSSLDLNITDLDVSAANRTRPNKTGTSAPATCSVGDTFFDSDATAGFNTAQCTATNTWTDPVAASPTWSGTHTFSNNPKVPGLTNGSTDYLRLAAGYFHIGPNNFAFGPTTAGGSDLILRRIGGGHLRLGDTDTASPENQTISTRGATGTDKSGGTFILQGSLGTGNGIPGEVQVKTGSYTPTSGSGAQVSITRQRIGRVVPLTDGSATTIESLPISSNTMIGGVIEYNIVAKDSTDLQSATGVVYYSAVNKGGTITTTVAATAAGGGLDPVKTLSAGTLSITWALSAANPAILSVNADTSLTPSSGYPYITYTFRNLAHQ